MIAIVAPEPAPWLADVIAALGCDEAVRVFAPWAVPSRMAPLGRVVPPAARAALARRIIDVPAPARDDGIAVDGPRFVPWPAVEGAARVWARGRADRTIRARLALRRGVDSLAARWLPRDALEIYAPSLAARRTFSAALARDPPARCILIEDLPGLRDLHDDLDRAAVRHPAARFLTRYRARPADLARQEAERVLSDRLLVAGRWALERRHRDGFSTEKAGFLDATSLGGGSSVGTHAPCPPRSEKLVLLLAGPGTARGGLYEGLAALAAMPGATLLVRVGDGLEPPDAMTRPGVRAPTPAERSSLEGVTAVLAPAWCECYPPEVPLAASLGIPVVATARAAGTVDLSVAGVEIDPGDVGALVAALRLVSGASITPIR